MDNDAHSTGFKNIDVNDSEQLFLGYLLLICIFIALLEEVVQYQPMSEYKLLPLAVLQILRQCIFKNMEKLN